MNVNVYYCLIISIIAIFSSPLSSAKSSAKEPITFKVSLSDKKSQLLLPVPNHLISIDSNIQLTEMNIPIDIKYKILNQWPTFTEKKYIRLLLLEVNHLPGDDLSLELKWGDGGIKDEDPKLNLHQGTTLVFPSSNWLAQSVLLHPSAQHETSNWYTQALSSYAHFITDQKALSKMGYPMTRAAQWLYDKPQAIYQLFIVSGNKKWLSRGDDLANFYINNIDGSGLFKLIDKNDVKYLMPKGLLYSYFLSGNIKAKEALTNIYQNSLMWEPEYDLERGFWTERNQAAALNTAISYWEVTGDRSAFSRINQIIDATVEMTFNPVNNWSLVGCPQHTLQSHEGQGGSSPTCSPWMMALLSDALWRFYRLTGDVRAASLIDAFGDFVLNYGIYWGDEKVDRIVIPKYLAILQNSRYENHDQWSDYQHTCDVAALLGKSVYIKKRSDILLKELFSVFVQQCKAGLERTKVKQGREHYWTITPPRRFNWMFSSTSDLPWLADFLLLEVD